MLANGAHLEIDDIPLFIAEQVESHYVHRWVTPIVQRTDVAGEPGKQQLFPDRLLWSFDDWSGGEGNRIYYKDEGRRYHYSNGLNPRIAGRLSGAPTRTVTAVDSLDCRDPIVNCTAGGALFALGGANTTTWRWSYTTNGTSWNNSDESNIAGVDSRFTAACGDFEFVYGAIWLPSTPDATIWRKQITLNPFTLGGDTQVTLNASNTPIIGMALRGQSLFSWNGRKLREISTKAADLPVTTGDVRDDTGDNPGTPDQWGTSWWGKMVNYDGGLIYFVSAGGRSEVRDYTGGAAGSYWKVPDGYTIRDIDYHLGTLWVVGHWGTDADPGRGTIWAVPAATRQAKQVHEFRGSIDGQYLKPTCVNSSAYGQLTIGCDGGQIFVYDIARDSMSMLDTLATASGLTFDAENTIWSNASLGKRRFFFVSAPGAAGATDEDMQVVHYEDDNDVGSWANQTLETGDWDYDYPHQLKKLMGITVSFKPLVTNQSITISYSKDQGTNYTNLTAITSATSGNSDGRVFLPISVPGTDFNFYNLRFKIEAESSDAGTDSPTLFAVTAEARLVPTTQRWDLAVLVTDEPNTQRAGNDQRDAVSIRDALYAMKEAGEIVTFEDGYRNGQNIGATTYNVVVKDVTDIIVNNGQGFLSIELEEAPE